MATNRDKLMSILKERFPDMWMKTGVGTFGSEGGIWTGEGSMTIEKFVMDDKTEEFEEPIFEYDAEKRMSQLRHDYNTIEPYFADVKIIKSEYLATKTHQTISKLKFTSIDKASKYFENLAFKLGGTLNVKTGHINFSIPGKEYDMYFKINL